jgi:hypothetical protein
MISFVTKYNILTKFQNGFRKNRSTETASQTFIEKIQEAMDRRLYVVGIFFDLTKAYDVIDPRDRILCPNNPLNMHAFMHKKLPKYALKYAHKNLHQILKLFLHYFKANKSIVKVILCNH